MGDGGERLKLRVIMANEPDPFIRNGGGVFAAPHELKIGGAVDEGSNPA